MPKSAAFVAMHGSSNRGTGYKVVKLVFDAAGNATGEYEDFMTGFAIDAANVWGRPSASPSPQGATSSSPKTVAAPSGRFRSSNEQAYLQTAFKDGHDNNAGVLFSSPSPSPCTR